MATSEKDSKDVKAPDPNALKIQVAYESMESTPSVWFEQRSTGFCYGVKVYDADPQKAMDTAKRLLVECEKVAASRIKGSKIA